MGRRAEGVFVTQDGGASWRRISSAVDTENTSFLFKMVAGQVLYGTHNHVITRQANGITVLDVRGTLIDHRALPSPFWFRLRDIAFLDENNAWAFGKEDTSDHDIYFTSDGGKTWSKAPVGASIEEIFAVSAKVLWFTTPPAELRVTRDRGQLGPATIRRRGFSCSQIMSRLSCRVQRREGVPPTAFRPSSACPVDHYPNKPDFQTLRKDGCLDSGEIEAGSYSTPVMAAKTGHAPMSICLRRLVPYIAA